MKVFYIFYILSLSFFANAGYVTMPGPLQLSDKVEVQNGATGEVVIRYTRGAIVKNLTSKLCFLHDIKKLMTVYKIENCQDLPCYQQMMLDLDKKNISNEDALILIAVFEKLLMDLVSDELYFLGGYVPYVGNIISGVRYKWINPFSWMNPFNYCGENNDKVYQLLYEMDQLADIAYKYDSLVATRLKVAFFSYLHWRKVVLGAIFLAYLPDIKKKLFKPEGYPYGGY
jgi:hypothetical protein